MPDRIEGGERARRAPWTWRRAALVIGAVVVAGAAVAVWLTRPGPTTAVQRGGLGAVEPFDERGLIEPGPSRAVFSDDGNRIAVLGARGVGIAERGSVRWLIDAENNVVDAAWLPGTGHLLVAEGPGETGRLNVLNLEGTSLGFVPLRPSFGVGTGNGVTVDRPRRNAVVGAVRRDALGPTRRHLVLLDLKEGTHREITPPDGEDEAWPLFVDDSVVVFTASSPDGRSVGGIDIVTGATWRLSAPRESASAAGVIDGRLVVMQIGRDVVVVPGRGGRRQVLATLPVGATLVTVDPNGGRAIVAETLLDARRLRVVTLRRPS